MVFPLSGETQFSHERYQIFTERELSVRYSYLRYSGEVTHALLSMFTRTKIYQNTGILAGLLDSTLVILYTYI